MRSTSRTWVALLAAFAAIGIPGCGAEVVGSGPPTTSPGDTAARASTIGVPDCDAVAPLGPIPDTDPARNGNPPIGFQNVLSTYADRHPDEFLGLWIDRVHGGTYVMAFTGDPIARLQDLEALRPAPGDHSLVSPAVKADGTPGTLPPDITADTSVADAGWPLAVVQAPRSKRDLDEIRVSVEAAVAAAGRGVVQAGVEPTLGRVVLLVDRVDDELRAQLAFQAPSDAVCLSHVPTPEEKWPAGVPKPTSLIPAEGADPWVTCQSSVAFPYSRLAQPLTLDPADPLAKAFTAVATGTPGGPGIPPSAYRLLVQTDEAALFLADLPSGIGTIAMHLEQGRWISLGASFGGRCVAQSVTPDGLRPVDWSLDSNFPAPGAADTQIHLLVHERACNSGQVVGDRLRPAEIVERGSQVLVAFAATLPEGRGGADCQSNPSTPVTVTLPGPLGDRTLADGSYVPPKPPDPWRPPVERPTGSAP